MLLCFLQEKHKTELVNKVNSANSDELILDILNAEINNTQDNKTIISEYFIFEVFVIHEGIIICLNIFLKLY